MGTPSSGTADHLDAAGGSDALPRKPAPPKNRASLFSQLAYPCVLSTPNKRGKILETAADPVWQRFIAKATIIFQNEQLPAPTFPIFFHDGDLDRVIDLSVWAYISRKRRYLESLARWLREIIARQLHHRHALF